MLVNEWPQFTTHILQLEQAGLVTRTFRRLDPERQAAVLDAILEEAAAVGPEAISIKEVARRAGVSIGSLYTYFPDRDGMLEFAVELALRYFKDLFELSRPALLALPLREALFAYLSYGVEWSRSQASVIHLFARAAYGGDRLLNERLVRPVAGQMLSLVRDLLAAAAGRGELRAGLDLEASTRLVHLLTLSVGDSQLLPYLNSYFQVTAPDLPFERSLEALLDLILKGIGPITKPEV